MHGRRQTLEREVRFEAARAELAVRLLRGKLDEGWFRAPGVIGCHNGRDGELRWAGGPHALSLDLMLRIRMGEPFQAKARHKLWRWFGFPFLSLRGELPEGVAFAIEQLLRDFGVERVWCEGGRIGCRAEWNPDDPQVERVLAILERLHRVGLALEDVREAPQVAGGDVSCPFCRTLIAPEDPLARCEACFTPHHPSCFEENYGCAVYGCENRSARTRSGVLPRELVERVSADKDDAAAPESERASAEAPEPGASASDTAQA